MKVAVKNDEADIDKSLQSSTSREFRSSVERTAECSAQTLEADSDLEAARPQKEGGRKFRGHRFVAANGALTVCTACLRHDIFCGGETVASLRRAEHFGT
jgi:hypothetical protein